MMKTLPPLVAECLGTALLLVVVVGSGIMAQRLHPGQDGTALLANTLATGAGLLALILAFGRTSGAHFNPLVTVLMVLRGTLPKRQALGYALAQILGAASGVLLAHALFDLTVFQMGLQTRTGTGIWLSESIATAGLLLVIVGTGRSAPGMVPLAVAGWVMAGYWCTASTCFANPAVTLARGLTGTFAGIRPDDILGFLVAQGLGLLLALLLIHLLDWKDDSP